MIELDAIRFNHDPAAATRDALNIRINATTPATAPEWVRGRTFRPQDSPAAYALSTTAGNDLTIQVQLRRLNPAIGAAEVRAVEPLASAPWEWWLEWLLRPFAPWPGLYYAAYTWYRTYLAQLQPARPRNVLGDVVPRRVHFRADGTSGFVTFELDSPRIWSRGVGVDDVVWRWQYRLDTLDPWADIALTSHRVYTVIAPPLAPWQQQPDAPGNTQLPWSEVLDVACRWAEGASNVDDAAARVTQAVFNLGTELIAYDCPGGGITHYTAPIYPYFNCTEFLERVRGGIGNGYYVNCTDCAAIVSTFANILGCDLWQSTMGKRGFPFFGVNPIRAIGSSFWQTPCGWGAFDYHEVAWTGACGPNDTIYDACLLVDADPTPDVPPHVAELPVKIVFGEAGEGRYRDHLATIAGRADCAPQPQTRLRRLVI